MAERKPGPRGWVAVLAIGLGLLVVGPGIAGCAGAPEVSRDPGSAATDAGVPEVSREPGSATADASVSAPDEAVSAPGEAVSAPDASLSAPDASPARALLEDAAPAGFHLDFVTTVPPPSLAPIMTDRTYPSSTTVGVYRANDDPPRAITATLATFAEPVGASALYNRYFATSAFMASIDRQALDIGDQAECFDGQWPPFHAVIARENGRFVLVEADMAVPREHCRDLVAALVNGRTGR